MLNNKIILSVTILFCTVFSLFSFTPVWAGSTVGDVHLVNPLGGSDTNTVGDVKINTLLGKIVGKALLILGSISLLVLVAGGFLWLTSAGNAEKVKLGTNTMLYAIIGLFIIFSSYAILNTVIDGLTGGKIASQSSGATESSETTGGKDTKTPLEKANEICKSKNSEFSCVNIVNCAGVTGVTNPDKTIAKEACTKAGDGKCINGACPGVDDLIKCCKLTVPATQTTSGSSTGNSCGGAEHPTWSCMNILNCDIDLTGKSSVSQQRAVCKSIPDKCVTGKCSGEDNIVCCESECNGGKGCSENQFCFVGECKSRCNIKIDQTGFDEYCGTAYGVRLSWCKISVPPLKFDRSKTQEVKNFCVSKQSKEECSDDQGEKKASVFCSWFTDKEIYGLMFGK